MSMLSSIINSKKKEDFKKEEIEKTEQVEDELEATLEVPLESPAVNEKTFKVKFSGKKYKVLAVSESEAVEKVKKLLGMEDVEVKEELPKITIGDIFNAISEEIKRIVTVAHPETVTNSYDRWVSVITEELGEVVHELNDAYEGKPAKKNTFVECIQLCSATILLAKKFANEHSEMFVEDKLDEKL